MFSYGINSYGIKFFMIKIYLHLDIEVSGSSLALKSDGNHDKIDLILFLINIFKINILYKQLEIFFFCSLCKAAVYLCLSLSL